MEISSGLYDSNYSEYYFTVFLDDISSTEVLVKYHVTGGSALRDKDYSLIEGIVVFKPFEKYKYFAEPLRIINDSEAEGNETIEITISDPVNAIIGAKNKFTYSIADKHDASNEYAHTNPRPYRISSSNTNTK